MPVYKNTGTSRVVLSGQPIEPGDTITTLIEYDLTGLNVTKTSDNPMDNRVIYSDTISTDSTIVVPLNDSLNNPVEKYFITIYVEAGEVSILFNSSSNIPPMKLYKGAKWRTDCWSRTISDIRISFDVSGDVWVSIERL